MSFRSLHFTSFITLRCVCWPLVVKCFPLQLQSWWALRVWSFWVGLEGTLRNNYSGRHWEQNSPGNRSVIAVWWLFEPLRRHKAMVSAFDGLTRHCVAKRLDVLISVYDHPRMTEMHLYFHKYQTKGQHFILLYVHTIPWAITPRHWKTLAELKNMICQRWQKD